MRNSNVVKVICILIISTLFLSTLASVSSNEHEVKVVTSDHDIAKVEVENNALKPEGVNEIEITPDELLPIADEIIADTEIEITNEKLATTARADDTAVDTVQIDQTNLTDKVPCDGALHHETVDLRRRLDAICRSTIKAGVLKKVSNDVCLPLSNPIVEPDFFVRYGWLIRLVGFGVLSTICIVAISALHDAKPSGGKNLRGHIFFAIATWIFFSAMKIVPEDLSHIVEQITSPSGNTVVGIVFPLIQSLKALATVQDDDDTRWLTYWVVYAAFAVLAHFLDIVLEYWVYYNEAEFIFLLWLQLPFTDGCRIVHDYVLSPLLFPLNRVIDRYVTQHQTVFTALVILLNLGGCSSLFVLFAIMPEFIGALCCTIIGVVFPALASFHALSTTTTKDDSQWLTYWVAFSAFCVASEWTEEILFHLPNFHKFMLLFIVWLQLPFFHGAQLIYRSILVPLFGMQGAVLKGELQQDLLKLRNLKADEARDILDTVIHDAKSLQVSLEATHKKKTT